MCCLRPRGSDAPPRRRISLSRACPCRPPHSAQRYGRANPLHPRGCREGGRPGRVAMKGDRHPPMAYPQIADRELRQPIRQRGIDDQRVQRRQGRKTRQCMADLNHCRRRQAAANRSRVDARMRAAFAARVSAKDFGETVEFENPSGVEYGPRDLPKSFVQAVALQAKTEMRVRGRPNRAEMIGEAGCSLESVRTPHPLNMSGARVRSVTACALTSSMIP